MNKVLGFAGRHWVLTTLLVLVVGIAAWWQFAFPSATWRYKMTVTVETPEGIKTGSAVRQIGQFTDFKIGDVGGGSAGAIGEAVVVDLGARGKLFALLDGDDAYRVVFNAFPFEGANTPEGIKYYSHLKNAKASLVEKNNIPTMVTFKDLKDPKTVMAVDRANLAGVFGTGVKLKDVTIEMTDEPVTWKIDTYLSWLLTLKANLDGSDITTGSSYANTLHVGYFKRGNK